MKSLKESLFDRDLISKDLPIKLEDLPDVVRGIYDSYKSKLPDLTLNIFTQKHRGKIQKCDFELIWGEHGMNNHDFTYECKICFSCDARMELYAMDVPRMSVTAKDLRYFDFFDAQTLYINTIKVGEPIKSWNTLRGYLLYWDFVNPSSQDIDKLIRAIKSIFEGIIVMNKDWDKWMRTNITDPYNKSIPNPNAKTALEEDIKKWFKPLYNL